MSLIRLHNVTMKYEDRSVLRSVLSFSPASGSA